jgi:DinB superfamily
MNTAIQIAKHFRDVHFGGNWTSVNLKDSLNDITWQQATTKLYSLNTIAALVYHINYYVKAVSKVLTGEPLNAHDKYSFDVPSIGSEEGWQDLLNTLFADAEYFAGLIERLPDSKLQDVFMEEKYGTYYRNLHGIIEHTHYHLGQIVLIKKIVATG